jgi:hypothetical protein
MAKYYKIDSSKGRDTNVILIFIKDEKEGEDVSKTYRTVLSENYQSFLMRNYHSPNFKENIKKERVEAVEITVGEYNKLSDELKEQLC